MRFAGLALFLCACSSNSEVPSVDAAAEAAPSVCATDPRVRPFVSGLEVKTASGARLKIVDATPAPPAKGDNAWNLTLSDASGAPIDGATVTVKPWMPDHGHGSSIKPAVTPAGAGRYLLTRLNLFMPGIWELTFTIKNGDRSEDALVTLCVST